MQNFKKVLLIVIIFSILNVLALLSEEYINKNIGYSIDLPYKWKIVDEADSNIVSFSSQDGSAVFQVYSFKGNTFNTPEKIFNFIKKKLNANGDRASFNFSGRDSVFSDLTFESNSFKARGYFVFVNGKKFDFALLSYSNSIFYKQNHDFILSVLDSFSINEQGKVFPGPVSQFYYPGDSKNKKKVKLVVWGKTIETTIDYDEIEATKVLIEREARILETYKPGKDDIINPWNRYYNLIYRDNYSRVKDLSSLIIESLDLDTYDSNEIVRKLVLFIQNFKFTRTAVTDITSPLDSLYSFTGDCDSRTLLLTIILHQIGIDAVLLVSTKYKHSAIGINMGGDGARIKFKGKSYLYTELTEVVDIGLVPKKTADLSAWTSMNIGY